MSTSLNDLITRIQKNLREGIYENERVIESRVIIPILRELGWDTENPRIVAQQYSAIPGWRAKKVDFTLLPDGNNLKPSIFIEAKNHGALKDETSLSSAEDQLSEYESHYRVDVAVITDGEIWNFYNPSAGGTYRDRLAVSVNLALGPSEQTLEILTLLLSFETVKSKIAASKIKELHARRYEEREIQNEFGGIWSDLLNDPSDSLITAVQTEFQKKSRHSPSIEQIRELIQRVNKSADVELFEEETISNLPIGECLETDRGQTKIKVTINWRIAGRNKETEIVNLSEGAETLVEVLRKLIREFGNQTINQLGSVRVRKHPLVSTIKSQTYQQSPLEIGNYLVLTHSSSKDKVRILEKVCDAIRIKKDFLKTEIIPK